MKAIIKKILPQFILRAYAEHHEFKKYTTYRRAWLAEGAPLPAPHEVKKGAIRKWQKRFHINYLVESGTYKGEMIAAMLPHFDHLFTIELAETLHQNAVTRFKGINKVTLYQGDSGQVMPMVVEQLTQSAIFWLDGHYSFGETAKGSRNTPIYAELTALAQSPYANVILIDDARHFNGSDDYPALADLYDFAQQHLRLAQPPQVVDDSIVLIQKVK